MLDFLVQKHNASFINAIQNTHFITARKSLETTQSIQPFQVKNRYNALTVNLKPNQKTLPFELHFHDIMGHKSEEISTTQEYPFFKKTNSILFIINPYHVPAFGKKRGIL